MRKLLLVAALGGSLVCTAASAAPTPLAQSSFKSSDIVVNFDHVGDEVAITNQYSSDGVMFSGGLLGMANTGDTVLFPNNGGGSIASNWNYSHSQSVGASFTAQFSSVRSSVGFYLENWPQQIVSIDFYLGAALTGTVLVTTQNTTTVEFKGFQDLNGFDKLVFKNTAQVNGFYAIDDFRFSAPVPEPETYGMLLAGLGLIGMLARRRKA